MVAGDRCCQRRHPVWKYVFLFFFSFFLLLFFSWVLLSFSRRGEKKGVEEGRRWDESGVRQDLRRAVWTGPNLGELMKNIDSCSHSQGLRSWKTNLKHNLGNQLRSPWEPGEKKERGGKGPPFSPPTSLSFPFLHLTGTWVCPSERCRVWGGFVSRGLI